MYLFYTNQAGSSPSLYQTRKFRFPVGFLPDATSPHLPVFQQMFKKLQNNLWIITICVNIDMAFVELDHFIDDVLIIRLARKFQIGLKRTVILF